MDDRRAAGDVDKVAQRPVDEERLRGAVAFLRGAFHNDGAEGESVHRVCADALALFDRLDALEKAILSSAGDEAQREAAIDSTVAINFEPAHRPLRKLASAYLAQSKALADLRDAALKLGGTRCMHTAECKSHGGPTVPCDCYVNDVDNLLVLAKWPGLPKNEEG